MPAKVKSFPDLIRALADEHHGGKVLPMAERTGLSPAILARWYHGQTREPTLDSLLKLCAAYHLEVVDVLALVARRRRPTAPIAGGSAQREPRRARAHATKCSLSEPAWDPLAAAA